MRSDGGSLTLKESFALDARASYRPPTEEELEEEEDDEDLEVDVVDDRPPKRPLRQRSWIAAAEKSTLSLPNRRPRCRPSVPSDSTYSLSSRERRSTNRRRSQREPAGTPPESTPHANEDEVEAGIPLRRSARNVGRRRSVSQRDQDYWTAELELGVNGGSHTHYHQALTYDEDMDLLAVVSVCGYGGGTADLLASDDDDSEGDDEGRPGLRLLKVTLLDGMTNAVLREQTLQAVETVDAEFIDTCDFDLTLEEDLLAVRVKGKRTTLFTFRLAETNVNENAF